MSKRLTNGSEYAGNQRECPNCGLEMPEKPVVAGVKGLRKCPLCGEKTALGRSVDTDNDQSGEEIPTFFNSER